MPRILANVAQNGWRQVGSWCQVKKNKPNLLSVFLSQHTIKHTYNPQRLQGSKSVWSGNLLFCWLQWEDIQRLPAEVPAHSEAGTAPPGVYSFQQWCDSWTPSQCSLLECSGLPLQHDSALEPE